MWHFDLSENYRSFNYLVEENLLSKTDMVG